MLGNDSYCFSYCGHLGFKCMMWSALPSIAELGSAVGPAAQYVASHVCRPGWLELLAVVSLVLVAAALAGCCGCVAGLALGLSLNPHGAEAALQAGRWAVGQLVEALPPRALRRLAGYRNQ